MNINLVKSEKTNKIGHWLFYVALVLLIICVVIRRTYFAGMELSGGIVKPTISYLKIFLFILILIKIVFFDDWDWRELGILGVFGALLLYTGIQGHNRDLFIAVLFVIGSKNIPLKRIFQIFFYTLAGLLVFIIGCSFIGILPNLVEFRSATSLPRQCLGFVNYTPLSFCVLFMLVALVGSNIDSDNKWLLASEFIGVIVTGIVFYYVTGIRNDLICALLLALVIPWKLYRKALGSTVARIIIVVFPVLAFLWTIISTYCYSPKSAVWQRLNELFSGRLMLDKAAAIHYPAGLLGHYFKQGARSRLKVHGLRFYLDSSLDRVLFMNGIITFIILFLLIQWAFVKIVKEGTPALLALTLIFIITMIEGLSSSKFLTIGVNSSLFLLGIVFNRSFMKTNGYLIKNKN